ncbi:MAG: tyrosine-type recombinase/integrase [Candidatus Babeliales bacterium]
MAKRLLTDPFIKNYPNPVKRIRVYDTKVTGLVLVITPTGKKSFEYRYYFNQLNRGITIGSYPKWSLSKAREKAKSLHRTVSDGFDPSEQKRQRKSKVRAKTFGDIIERYRLIHLPEKKKSTREDYSNRIRNFIEPKFKNCDLESITRAEVFEFLEDIKIKRPVHAQRIQAILSGIFNFAKDRGYIKDNPAQKIKLIVPKDYERDRRFTNKEIIALWNAFNLQAEPVQSLFKMLLVCGQRSGETKLMKWNCINNGIWTVSKEDTKANRANYVPLPSLAQDILKDLKPLTGKSQFVFQSDRMKDTPVQYIQHASKRIKKLSGVLDFRPHDLRRTLASGMAELGTPEQVLSRILNHSSSGNSVTKVYDRYDYMSEKTQAMNRWCHHLVQIINGEETP